MKKILFGVAALGLLGLAGAGLGLKAQDAIEAKADGTYYLVGSGSFKGEGDIFSIASGVETNAIGSDLAVLKKQLLTEGDIFKLTDGSVWKGYDNYKDRVDANFANTALDIVGGQITCNFECQPSWWGNSSCYTRIETSGSPIDAHNQIQNMGSNSGKVTFYSDCTRISFYRYNATEEFNKGEFYVDLSDVTWDHSLNFYVFDNSGGRGASKDNADEGTNIRVKRTSYYNLYVNYEGNLYINDTVQEWIGNYMHMDSEVEGQCVTYYPEAKAALLELGSDIIGRFRSDASYEDALERYTNWAAARNDATPFAVGLGDAKAVQSIDGAGANAILTIAVSTVGAILLGGVLIIARKRRAE